MKWTETNEDHFDEMLGCVPPIKLHGNAFLCGEPIRYNDNGERVYGAYIIVNHRSFESERTVKQWKPKEWIAEICFEYAMELPITDYYEFM